MLKVMSPLDWDFDISPVSQVKVASRGLLGHDLHNLIKRAGHDFALQIKQAELKPGDIPVHLVALGATEGYGPNRNGDGFSMDTCRKKHDTFVKHARWYRLHKNKDPENSWGFIKLSHLNEPMQRIELLAILNDTKEAAERNGGHVADEEMAMLAKGEPIPVSMACKLAYDVCVHCGNKARSRSEYCTESTCPAGGCRHNLMKVGNDGRIPYVDNPAAAGLIWFDMSKVRRPADRTAYGWAAEYLDKAASGDHCGGEELAELVGAELPLAILFADSGLNRTQLRQAAELQKLAADELAVEMINVNRNEGMLLAEKIRQQAAVDVSELLKVGSTRHALQALAAERIVLPVKAFLQWQLHSEPTKLAQVEASIQDYMPGAFGRIANDLHLPMYLRKSPYTPADFASQSQKTWALKQAGALSLSSYWATDRAYRAAVCSVAVPRTEFALVKKASDNSLAAQWASQYAIYAASALAAMPEDHDLTLTRKLVVLQNHVR